jgi:hypothetical protein
MYFGIEEEAKEGDRRSAVWAIDLGWLEGKTHELLRPEAKTSGQDDLRTRAEHLNILLGQTEKPVVVRMDPPRINERMAAQQGLFLCKLYHQATFSQILMTMMIHPETPDRPVVRRLEVDSNCRVEFLKILRSMNIHRASLFPGLDGFCQSLRLDLEIKDERNDQAGR